MLCWACLLALLSRVAGQYVALPFSQCPGATAAAGIDLLNVSTFLGQYDTGQTTLGQYGSGSQSLAAQNETGNLLRLVAIAQVGEQSEGFSNITDFLATVITQAQVVSFTIFYNNSALCSSIRNTTGDADPTGSGCPYGPGDVAFGIDVVSHHAYTLTAIDTQIRILDSSVPPLQLGCYTVSATTFYPRAWPYRFFLWLPVSIAIAYAVLNIVGRLWAAHVSAMLDREAMLASSLTAKLSHQRWRQRVAPVLWYAASGIGLQSSASLRRFATPGARDFLWTVQWICLLGMVAVNWPNFAYPILAKTAWSMLAFNVTLTQGVDEHVDPLIPAAITTPFDALFPDATSPLYLDASLPNVLLDLNATRNGLDSLSASIGLRRQDMFGVAATIFLMINAGFVAASMILMALDVLLAKVAGEGSAGAPGRRMAYGDDIAYARKTSEERSEGEMVVAGENKALASTPKAEELHTQRSWYKSLSGTSIKAHVRLLQETGNLTRNLLYFHLPLVVLSTYQLSLASSVASTSSVALAALCLILLCIAAPSVVTYKVLRSSNVALQKDLATGLVYGSFYSIYSDWSHSYMSIRLLLNLVVGIVVGAAQNSGTAQAIVILVCEIGETLLLSLWLPWGDGAAMGLLSFVRCVARVVTAVLVVVLAPAVGISVSAADWIAYVILVIAAATGVLFLFILLAKTVELCVRIFGGVPFDESASRNRSGGLAGALRRWDRAGKKGLRHSHLPVPQGSSLHLAEDPSAQHLRSRPTSMATSGFRDPFAVHTPTSPPADELDGYAMSPASRGWSSSDYVSGSDWRNRSRSWGHDGPSPDTATSFTVVRGGRATDQAPYALRDGFFTRPQQVGAARSQPHDIDYVAPASRSRTSIDLLSNAAINPLPAEASAGYLQPINARKRASAASVTTGIFGFLRRGASEDAPAEDDFSSDEEDDEAASPSARSGTQAPQIRWPFGIRTRQQRSPEATPGPVPVPEQETEDAVPPGKSFVVVRPSRVS